MAQIQLASKGNFFHIYDFRVKPGTGGQHATPHSGRGSERLSETRPYAFGDEVADIDYNRSFHNAFFRADRVRYAHFVWHLFVLAGTACHFVAVFRYAG